MKREIKFYFFMRLLELATRFLPKDAKQTWTWLSKMPIEK